jgi:hypothetical protein
VFDAYRGRGKRTNALWLVHSVKTNRDWILSSDRQLVHWLLFLETEPSVKSFEFDPDSKDPAGDNSVAVLRADGSKETHIVIAGAPTGGDGSQSQDNEAELGRAKIFTDVDLKPGVPLAMRWHKALSFAAAIRDKECLPIRLALVPLLRSMGEGTVGQISQEMSGFEEPSVLGMLVRLAVEGHVTVDLRAHGFCYCARWAWREGGRNVVA